MANKIIIFSGKQYSGKDTAAKILMDAMPSFRRCAMGDIIKIEYGKLHNLTYQEIETHKAQYRQGLIDLGNWGRSGIGDVPFFSFLDINTVQKSLSTLTMQNA